MKTRFAGMELPVLGVLLVVAALFQFSGSKAFSQTPGTAPNISVVGTPPAVSGSQPAATSGTAVSAAPLPKLSVDSGVLQPESVIEITFPNPVAKPGEFNTEAEPGFLEVSPGLAGRLVWISERVARYELAEAPKPATEYTFSLGNTDGVIQRTGLAGGMIGKVSSSPFKVERCESPGYWFGGEIETPTIRLICWFTDDVSPDATKLYAYFKDDAGNIIPADAIQATLEDVKRTYKAPKSLRQRFEERPGTNPAPSPTPFPENARKEPVGNGIVYTPSRPLPAGKGWRFFLENKFSATRGGALLNETFHKELGNLTAPSVRAIECAPNPGGKRAVIVQFNGPLADAEADRARAKELVELQPPVANLEVNVGWRSVTLTGNFALGTDYLVKIKRGLKAKNGIALQSDYQGQTRFQPSDPTLTLPSFDSAQFSNGRRHYEVHSVNMKNVRVRIKALNGTELVRALQSYDRYSGRRRTEEDHRTGGELPFELMAGTVVHDKEYRFEKEDLDSVNNIQLDWSALLGPTRPAALFISSEALQRDEIKPHRNEDPKLHVTQALVQITDLGVAWKQDVDGVRLYVFSCQTGDPVAGATVQVFGEDAAPISNLSTDASGGVQFPVDKAALTLKLSYRPPGSEKAEDQFCLIFDNNLPQIPRFRFPIRIAYRPQTEFRNTVSMFTDRHLYRPGETMHLKGIWRQRLDTQLRIPQEHEITLNIKDEDDRVLTTRKVKLTDLGTFAETFELPADTVGRFRAEAELPKPQVKPGSNGGEDTEEDEDEEIGWRWRRGYSNRGQRYVFSEDFLVQEFRRNSFELHLKAPQAPHLGGESEVELTANYLMGKPLSDGKVSWSVHTNPVGFYPERYSGFFFGDHARYDRYYWYRYFGFREENSDEEMSEGDSDNQSKDGKTGEIQLDPAGATRLVFPLPKYEFPSRIGVQLHAEVTDANQQTLADGISFQIPSSAFYLGMRRIDSLVHTGEEIPLDFITVTNQGEPYQKPVKATVTVEHELWNTVATRTNNGDTATRSESSRREVFRQEITLNGDKPATIKYTPAQAGSHYVVIRTKDDSGAEIATRVKINAYGTTGYAWEYEDGARIRLVPDKKEYLPGETAKILVQTPVDGTALVTLERNKIHRSFVTKLSSGAPVLEVPLTDADTPNVYVSVTLIKGARENQREIKEPIAKLGYCELKVRNRADRLAVNLTPASAVVRPGTMTSIEGVVTSGSGAAEPEAARKGWFSKLFPFGSSSKSAPVNAVANAEVTLWVVDEGVLQVAGYTNPDLMAALLPTVPLGVFAGTTLPLFLPEDPNAFDFSNKGFSAGGGGLSEAGKLRIDFNPCPLWLGSIRTDAKGSFRAEYKVPDSLTRFRVLAVAVAGERKFGNATSAVTVNKPLMLQPVVPRVAHVGDKLQVKAMVHNTSKVAGEFEVSLNTGENCPLDGGTGPARAILSKRIRLGVNESKAVPFDVSFEAMGDAQWDWKATVVATDTATSESEKAGLVDAVQSKFPIHYPLPLFREESFVRLNQNGTPFNLLKDLSQELLKGDGLLTVEITPSILTEAGAAIEHVLHYPYGCVEQTTSSLAPWFAAKDLRDYSPAMHKSDAEIADSIQHGANRLLSMQTGNGALAYWPGGTEPCLWGSAYGGMGLLLAKANGAQIPEDALNKLTNYLSSTLRNGEAYSGVPETRARILYILALAGKPELAFVANMAKNAGAYSPSTRGLLAMAIVTGGGSKEEARRVLEAPSTASGYESDMHFLGRSLDQPLELMGWCMADPAAPRTLQLVDSLISSRTREGHWGATINNAWSLNALAAYARSEKHATEPLSAELNGMGHKEQFSFQPGQKGFKEVRIPLKAGAEIPQLTALVQRGAPMYCRLHLVSRPQIAPVREVNNGFSISRTYQKVNPKGGTEPIGILQPGDIVLVTLSVHVPYRYEYLSVEDPLPAILEAVNPEFASQAAPNANALLRSEWNSSHVEYRDDRVAFFSDYTREGRFALRYLARVTGQGSVFAPPARVEAMYNPQKYGLSATNRLENSPATPAATK